MLCSIITDSQLLPPPRKFTMSNNMLAYIIPCMLRRVNNGISSTNHLRKGEYNPRSHSLKNTYNNIP